MCRLNHKYSNGLILTFFCVFWVSLTPVHSSTWNVDGGGNWNCVGNWCPSVPNGAGCDAIFDNTATVTPGLITICLNANITVDELIFDDNNDYTITGANTLDFDNAISVLNTVGNPNVTINVDVDIAGNSVDIINDGTGTLTFAGDIESVSNDSIDLLGTGIKIFTGSATGTFEVDAREGHTFISTGGTWDVSANSFDVGAAAADDATLTVNNCTTIAGANADLRVGFNGAGTLNVDGSGSLLTNTTGRILIGVLGDGTMNVINGADIVSANRISIGRCNNAQGVLNIDGCGSTATAPILRMGYGCGGGDGTVNISNGGLLDINGTAQVGETAGGTGVITIDGVTSVLEVDVFRAGNGSGTLNFNGGTVITSEFDGTGGNQVNFNGSVVRPTANNNDFISSGWDLSVQSGHAIFDTNGFDITIDEQFVEDAGDPGGGLIKRGTGTLTLDNATESTWTGDTRIEVGTLALGDNDVIGDSSNLDMAGGTFDKGTFEETFDNLTVSANSIINLNSGTNDLNFAGGNATFTAGVLSIYNWQDDANTFWDGTDTTGASTDAGARIIRFQGDFLSGGTTSSVLFYSDGGTTPLGNAAKLISLGGGWFELVPTTIVAVPESSSWLGGGVLLCFALWHTFRSRRRPGDQAACGSTGC